MTKLSHSFSAIKMYENCPKRYYHQRVLKEVKDQGGEATIWGERVHKFLEDRLAKATELPQEVARYDPLCQSIVKLAIGGELLVEQQLTLNVALEPTTANSTSAPAAWCLPASASTCLNKLMFKPPHKPRSVETTI